MKLFLTLFPFPRKVIFSPFSTPTPTVSSLRKQYVLWLREIGLDKPVCVLLIMW